MRHLKRRADFLRIAAKGRKCAAPGLVLQAALSRHEERPRIGFTVTRKVGNAVTRNRAKRRLRALAMEILAPHAHSDYDYVLIGRGTTPGRPFDALRRDLEKSMRKLQVWADERADAANHAQDDGSRP
ncbi:ribonuclease P protein component [Oceanibacterium hippocampi]|uniref:Ribonuclease P protein component n=1 Tax=Oceanibacterium hippocampi TaxID=745714 RepID=A0A1Y5RTW8_9PROT|nr:ribonuclease P protein component [Oceanibacterium hippocampi]SLN25354.1 Ribonuclease P protein component [Oceanibacterium hippocampi]